MTEDAVLDARWLSRGEPRASLGTSNIQHPSEEAWRELEELELGWLSEWRRREGMKGDAVQEARWLSGRESRASLGTSNIEHPTSNIQGESLGGVGGTWSQSTL